MTATWLHIQREIILIPFWEWEPSQWFLFAMISMKPQSEINYAISKTANLTILIKLSSLQDNIFCSLLSE